MSDLSDIDILSLDYDAKIKLLDRIAQEIITEGVRFAKLAGEYTASKATLDVLKNIKSALQSSLRAERVDL